MFMEITKEMLDAPAFTNLGDESGSETAPADASQAEKEIEKKEPASSSAEEVVDEQRVPYSRFSKQLERAREAERSCG